MALWIAEVLEGAGVDEVANWRMLEYWFQCEIYRAVLTSDSVAWMPLGHYEQPYYTHFPRSGSKTNTKWVDLGFVETVNNPQTVVWLELKDLGRSPHTVRTNAANFGLDLAALVGLDVERTVRNLRDPPGNTIKDKARAEEWLIVADIVQRAIHQIGQVALLSKELDSILGPEEIESLWSTAFRRKTGDSRSELNFGRSETERFRVHTLLRPLANT